MSRLIVALGLLVLIAGGAQAQNSVITDADQAIIDQIEAQLTMQGLEPTIETATDEQIAVATGQLVNPSRGASELGALVRAAVLARPSAVEEILREATGAAADQGFSVSTIGIMLAAAVGALQDLGIPYDLAALIAIVAEATGFSESAIADAAADAGLDEAVDLILEENPAQDASPT